MPKADAIGSILYLSYDGLTDPLGQSQILPYLEGLAGLGYQITIISFEKPTRFKINGEMVRQRCLEKGLLWKHLRYHKQPPVASTLFDLLNLRRAIKRIHKKRNFSIVHCRSYITSLAGLWMKKKYGTRFIFDMRGFWADERVEGQLWNLKNPLFFAIYRFFKKKEVEFLKGSDHVICLTENAAKEISQWGVTTPMTVIPCCVDVSHFDPATVTEQQQALLKEELGIRPGDFTLMYLGSWGTWYMTAEMLSFFACLKQQNGNAKFLILSPESVDLSNYSWATDVVYRFVPRANVPLYASIASASVFFIKPTFSKKASSATKMGELLAMNVPIITNRGWGDVEEISHKTSIYFKDDVIGNWDCIQRTDTRSFCVKHLSLKAGINQYAAVYESLQVLTPID